jgi:DNA-binding IscR family transcriptional regulator
VFQALLGKKQKETICTKFPGQKTVCAHNGECSLRPVWSTLSGYFDEVLKNLTLGDLMLREKETESRVSVLAADHAKRMTHLIQRTTHEKSV